MVIAGADFGSNKVGYIVAELKGGELETIERRAARVRRRHRGQPPSGEAMARTPSLQRDAQGFRKLGVEKFRGGHGGDARASNTPDFLELIEPILAGRSR
jgi:hypothetical protein